MNNLIKITEKKGTQLVDARELHQRLGSKRNFADWIKSRIEKYEFIENEDYFSFSQICEKPLGGRPAIEYHLTLTMAKELAMLQDNEMGRKIRRYFIEVEKSARKQFIQMPKSISVFGMEALPYDWWLLQNGYSVSSGQRNARIRKHPEHFYKGTNGWYINKLYAEALLAIKLGKEKLQQVQALPQVLQVEMF
ncbi:antA/AntB antirepressor family protein [Ornithobacterium rhinotracheale]|uniref:antA/AntB antirepressor family protein n=1 Tax=Ornithobacterium rhinotracheale TaxID=28251 RepID=UPI001FF57227|nr:antA/AntB antirepressor family protein [Ornithobacterium rhinotracheale]MCK0202166.1 antA/AntB antirepressor family protein [Ornithobacterium rhinotracheale]